MTNAANKATNIKTKNLLISTSYHNFGFINDI